MRRQQRVLRSRIGVAARSCAKAVATVLVLATVAVSCARGDGPSPEPAGAAGETPGDRGPTGDSARPYRVERATLTFIDDSRPTDHPDPARDVSTRRIETQLYLPQAEGRFPLIVHAHGFNGHPGKYSQLMTAWAAAGFVVAAPVFPLTNDASGAATVLGDYVNQPVDVAFVIDQVLDRSTGDDQLLGGRVDQERIAVSGHSLGGTTAYGLAFNDCCRDDRIDAVVLMSSLPLPFDGGSFRFTGVPLLLVQVTEDPIVPYDAAVTTYAEATSPKFLVTLEGGVHAEPYENPPSPHDEVVEAVTVAFWDAYLLEDPAGAGRVVEAAESSAGSSVTAEP